MRLAGITDIWSKTRGTTTTKMNVMYACFDALKKLMSTKIKQEYSEKIGIVEGNQK